jgi:endonuclease/exonuclease/phosphatase family metal-dependent hydrolase
MKSRFLKSGLLLLAFFSAASTDVYARVSPGGKGQLTVTQFNLRWFGERKIDGADLTENTEENRLPMIRKHMTDHHLFTDVLVFEEIVNVKLLAEGLLERQYYCVSYAHKDPQHQHVVVCVKPNLRFEKAPNARSYALDEVNLNGDLRPAVHGVIKTSSGKPLMHLFAVHLKSAPDFSEVRAKQMKVISDYMKHRDSDLPAVIVGDFNTYNDDPENFTRILAGNQMEEVQSPEAYSWATTHETYKPAKFDRTWVTGVLADKVYYNHVIGPCNQNDRGRLQRYNDTVSDHCAVKTIFDFD